MIKKIILFNILPFFVMIYNFFNSQVTFGLYSLLTIACIIGTSLLYYKFKFITKETYFLVVVFILLSVFAGRTLNFYSIIPLWDKILHFASGFIIFTIGKQVYDKMNNSVKNSVLKLWFSFFFALSLASVWEIYEFTIDHTIGTSAQAGSLDDTMWDIILGSISALITFVYEKIKLRRL